jgi:hypothetical protein
MDFCKESEMEFENNLILLDSQLPKEKKSRDAAIRKELLKLDSILLKLGEEYTTVFRQSMKTYKEHVSKAHHSVIEDFILPISIPGLTDY